MDPLKVARGLGKQVDVLLGNQHPIGHKGRLAHEGANLIDGLGKAAGSAVCGWAHERFSTTMDVVAAS
jgi:hypothetical protein